MAIRCHPFEDLVAVIQRGGHQIGSFIGCVTEHDPLIARAFILVVAGIHALRDVRRLAVQFVFKPQRLPVETVLFVTDALYRGAHSVFDLFLGTRHPIAVFKHALAADLPCENDALRGGQRFAGDACFGVFRQQQIDDSVGNLVGNLVRVAFGDAFRGEQIFGAHGSSEGLKVRCLAENRPLCRYKETFMSVCLPARPSRADG